MNRQRFLGGAKYAISFGLVFLILHKVKLGPVLEKVMQAHIGWLGLSLLCNFVIIWIQALRWKILMPGSRASVNRLFVWCFIGTAAGIVMPSAVAGDALRAVLLGKEEGQLGSSVASTIMGRVFGLIAMICLSLLGILFWPPLASQVSPGRILLLSGTVLATGSGLWLLARFRGSIPWSGKWVRRMESLVGHFSAMAREPGRMALTALLSFLLQGTAILSGWMLFRACGHDLSIAAAMALLPIVMLGTMAPLSIGGVGVREGLTVALFRQFASVPASVSLATNLVSYIAFPLIGIVGGLCWIFLRPREPVEGKGTP